MRYNVPSKACWCSELTENVALLGGFTLVQLVLQGEPSVFDRALFCNALKSKSRKIVDAMLPHPIDTLGRFVAEIAAVEVSAEE